MKVKIETEKAAAMFGCAVGEFRGLERPDASALIQSGDVSAAEADAEDAKPNRPARKRKS